MYKGEENIRESHIVAASLRASHSFDFFGRKVCPVPLRELLEGEEKEMVGLNLHTPTRVHAYGNMYVYEQQTRENAEEKKERESREEGEGGGGEELELICKLERACGRVLHPVRVSRTQSPFALPLTLFDTSMYRHETLPV